MYKFLDKEFDFLQCSDAARLKLWYDINEHKKKYKFPNLYLALDSYVTKFGFSFGIQPTYKGDSDDIHDYRFYINSGDKFLDTIGNGITYYESSYRNRDECLKACVKKVLYHIENLNM